MTTPTTWQNTTHTHTHTMSVWHYLNVLTASLSSPGFCTQRTLQRNNWPIIESLGLIHFSPFPVLQHILHILKNKLRRNSGGQNSLRRACIFIAAVKLAVLGAVYIIGLFGLNRDSCPDLGNGEKKRVFAVKLLSWVGICEEVLEA